MPRIVCPDDYPTILRVRPAFARLGTLGDLTHYDSKAETEAELIRRISGFEVVVNIRSFSKFTAGVFKAATDLKMLSIWGTGTNHVDLEAAAAAGVTVTSTPDTATDAIAEHSVALMLAVNRKLIELDRAVKNGQWPREFLTLACGKTLGIVGTGAIGLRTAVLGRGLGMNVIAWSRNADPDKAAAAGFRYVELDELLSTSDVVSVHLRLTEETEGFISAERLSKIKPSAILVNTARGAVVDEPALAAALADGRLAGAGLDVFGSEPIAAGDPILGLDNVVLTPHNAGQSTEVLDRGFDMAVDNVARYLAGEPVNVVV
jgi:D-3-phosphoglycerate dehydrogenase